MLESPTVATLYVIIGLFLLLTWWAYHFRHAPPMDASQRKRLREELFKYAAFRYQDAVYKGGEYAKTLYPGRAILSFLAVSSLLLPAIWVLQRHFDPVPSSVVLFVLSYSSVLLFLYLFGERGMIPTWWGLAIALTGTALPLLDHLDPYIVARIEVLPAQDLVMWLLPFLAVVPFALAGLSIRRLGQQASYRHYLEQTTNHLTAAICLGCRWVLPGYFKIVWHLIELADQSLA